MKFVCDRCQTRYSIADEKVRQKILRIRCKTCGNVIVVQGERASAGAAGSEDAHAFEHFEAAKTLASSSPYAASIGSTPKAAPTSAAKAAPTSAPKAAAIGVPKAHSSSAPKVAPAAVPKVGTAVPPPPPAEDGPDPLGGRMEWHLAIAGVRSGPFTRAEIARRVLATEPGKKVHVWKEGMPGWKPSDEVSVIARELSLLRPPASPPPPPPPELLKVAPPSAHPKVAAMPASAAKSLKAPEKQPPIFPGKPIKPRSAAISDSGDFTVDADPGMFADLTTKKAKNIHDLSEESGMDGFADVTSRKSQNSLESALAAAPASAKSDKTPPPAHPSVSAKATVPSPVHPFPPVHAKVAVPSPAASSSANLPAVATPPAASVSASHPAVAPATHSPPASAATSASSLPLASAISAGPSDLGGFSEVIQAVAASEPPSGSEQIFPDLVTPPGATAFPSPVFADSGAPKVSARPGVKYVAGAGLIVALVILIVMVTLRMDSRKVPDIEPVPAAPTEPAVVEPPKPAAVEPAKPEPAATAQNVRSGGKRGAGKSTRHVDVAPAPVHQPEPKQPSKPPEPHRPNPFDEAKATVSQSQISAVVRSKTNQAGLKTCYERALKMDNRLTSGRIDVTVSIGTSGIVQRVVINAPASFILVEPCIKSAVKRWVFPPSSEEYATNFPLIMQGGM